MSFDFGLYSVQYNYFHLSRKYMNINLGVPGRNGNGNNMVEMGIGRVVAGVDWERGQNYGNGVGMGTK